MDIVSEFISSCIPLMLSIIAFFAYGIDNGFYFRSDWLLKFLFRTSSATFTIAGLQAVQWKDRRMHNVDLTDVVSCLVRSLHVWMIVTIDWFVSQTC